MRIGRQEAFDIFRKWEAERRLLVCNLGFPLCAAAFRARITRLSPSELRLLSDDTHSEFAMKFKPDMQFHYEDSRGTPSEVDLYDCGVLITFPDDASQPSEERDHIGFTEVRER